MSIEEQAGAPKRQWTREDAVEAGRRGAKARAEGRVKGRDRPQLLKDMQHVYTTTPDKDRTEGHKKCREQWNTYPDKFFARMVSLEQSFLQATKSSPLGEGKEAPEVTDEGYENVMELIENWMKGWHANRQPKQHERKDNRDTSA